MSVSLVVPVSAKSARERVVRHLLAEFERLGLEVGTRLPPSRMLAKSLNVSLSTVQAAFRQLSEEGRVRTEIGNGTFLISKSQPKRGDYRIAISFPSPKAEDQSSWSGRISESIFQSSSDTSNHLTFFPLNYSGDRASIRSSLLEKRDKADALILLPHPHGLAIRELFEEVSKPVISYNAPSPEATTNFVSPDYYRSSLRLTTAWKKAGRKNIVLVTFGQLKDSVSALQRSLGILAGLGAELNRSIHYRVEEAPDTGLQDGYLCAQRMFSGELPPPDAIYCIGDLLGLGILNYLRDHGISCPQQVSVVGGSGHLGRDDGAKLTAIQQPFETVGKAITSMLIGCLEAAKPQSAVFLPCQFRGGKSTSAEENLLIEAAFAG